MGSVTMSHAVLICGAPASGKSTVLREILNLKPCIRGQQAVGVDNEDAFTKEMRKKVGDNVNLPNDDPRLMGRMSLPGQIFLQQMVMASATRVEEDQIIPQVVFFASPSENMTGIIKMPGREVRLYEKMVEDFLAKNVILIVRSLIMLPRAIPLADTLKWDLESDELPDVRLVQVEKVIQQRLKERSLTCESQAWLDAPKRSQPNYYWSRLRPLLRSLREVPEIKPIVFDILTDRKTIAQKVIDSIE